MSRGLGKLQRRILRALDGRRRPDAMTRAAWFTLADLGLITDQSTPAEQRSVRRAVAGLVERGLLQKATARQFARSMKGGPFRRSPACGLEQRQVLCVRRTVADDAVAAAEDFAEWHEYIHSRLATAYDYDPDSDTVHALQTELQDLGGCAVSTGASVPP